MGETLGNSWRGAGDCIYTRQLHVTIYTPVFTAKCSKIYGYYALELPMNSESIQSSPRLSSFIEKLELHQPPASCTAPDRVHLSIANIYIHIEVLKITGINCIFMRLD